MSQKQQLTQEYLKSRLYYSPDTGIFIWKYSEDLPKKWNSKWAGKKAGCVCPSGYISIGINNISYMAHRLAFFYIYGWWPPEVDHIKADGPKTDNRICNLRAATISQNRQNVCKPKRNTSGYKGVSLHKPTGRWYARIWLNNEKIHLGYYDTAEQAAEAYAEASLKYHGEYGRTK